VGQLWPVCQAWEAQGSRPLPRAGRDRLQREKAWCLSPGLLIQPILPPGRNTSRIHTRAQGRRKEERSSPWGCLQSRPCSPSALFWGGSPRHRLSPEKQFGVTPREDHKIFQDTFAAHTSLKHSTEVPKVKPGGREEGLRTANGATVGCAQCWSGGSYLLLRVRLERGPPASPRDVWGPPGRGGRGKRGRLSSAGGVPGHHGCCGQGKGWGVRSKPLAPAVLAPRAGASAEYVWQKGQWNLPEF